MENALISLLLSIHLLLGNPAEPVPSPLPCLPQPAVQESRVWWGLIDPELSLWFSALPDQLPDKPVLWDFSWRNFWAALWRQPLVKEDSHAAYI